MNAGKKCLIGLLAICCLAACGADDVGVERTRQTTLGGDDHQHVDLILAGAGEQGRGALTTRARGEAGDHALDPLGVRATSHRRFLRAAQLGGGDHLHRLGDLLRRLDRADADLEGLE